MAPPSAIKPRPPKSTLIVAPGGGPPAHAANLFDGWGTSLAWFAHATGADAAVRNKVCDLLFTDAGLGLNIVRYNIGGTAADAEDLGRFRAGGAVPCCCAPDGTYDGAADAAQTAYLLRARELIPADKLVTEAFCNSPPHFLLRSGTTRGHTKPFRNNLAKNDVPVFADALLSAVEHFRAAHGLHFTSLSPFNEPGSPAWIAPIAVQEGCYFSRGRMNDVLRALHARRALLGTTYVAAHEQFCVADAARDARATPARLWPAVGRVNLHTYDSSEFLVNAPWFVTKLQDNRWRRAALRRAAWAAGKNVWVSEFGTGKGAEGLAAHVVRDLSTLLPTGWVYWQAVEEPGSTWGLVQTPFKADACGGGSAEADNNGGDEQQATKPKFGDVIAAPQYHVMRRFVRAIPRGARVFPTPELKRRGAGAWLGPGRVVYAYVQPSKAKAARVLRIDAGNLRLGTPVAAAAAPAAAKGGKGGAAEGSAGKGAAAAGAGAGMASAAPARIKATVTAIDCAALDRHAGGDAGLQSPEVVREAEVGGDGFLEVEVAPGQLVTVELAVAAA